MRRGGWPFAPEPDSSIDDYFAPLARSALHLGETLRGLAHRDLICFA